MEESVVKTAFPTYPAYVDSGVEWLGEIPEGWELTRLGSYFKERRTKVSDKDFAPLSVTKNGILPQLENAAKSNDGDNRKLVKRGDFVINSRSDRKGSSGIAYEDGSVSLINIVLKPLSIDSDFCNFLLKSNAFVEENYRIGHGIVADLWTTRYDEMKNIKIGIPPLKEQTAIAQFLDEKTAKIDQAIAQKEKMIELLKERKQIMIQNAVTKGLDPSVKLVDSGVEWIGEIPEHWEVKRLKFEIKRNFSGGTPSTDKLDFWNGGIPWVSSVDVKSDLLCNTLRSISEKGLKNSSTQMAPEGAVVFVTRSGILQHTFALSILSREMAINQDIKCLVLSEQLLGLFFLRLVQGNNSKILVETRQQAATVESIDMSAFFNLSIPIPPLKEQEMIIDNISSESIKIDQSITLQHTQIQKLKEYKATLIDSAVTGKIKVC